MITSLLTEIFVVLKDICVDTAHIRVAGPAGDDPTISNEQLFFLFNTLCLKLILLPLYYNFCQ